MYNNIDYEKYLKNDRFGAKNSKKSRSRSSNKPRPGSRHNKLPPVPKSSASEYEKYLNGGGYLKKLQGTPRGGQIGGGIENLLNRAQKELDLKSNERNISKKVTAGSMQYSDSSNLMSSMAKRLGTLEKTVQSYRLELKLKNAKILKLEDRLQTYEENLEEEGDKNVLNAVIRKNTILKNELLKL
jgi:hypothetical protein